MNCLAPKQPAAFAYWHLGCRCDRCFTAHSNLGGTNLVTPLEKADVIDKHHQAVLRKLHDRLLNQSLWEEVKTVARGRHVLGHYEYGDTNLFEWSDGKVRAAIIEELADAVVYQSWLEERAERGNT